LRELKAQLIGALIVILTAAAVVCAVINFQQQTKWMLPEDGAIWVDRAAPAGSNQVVALDVTPGSAADVAGLEPGDVLRSIASADTRRPVEPPLEAEESGGLGRIVSPEPVQGVAPEPTPPIPAEPSQSIEVRRRAPVYEIHEAIDVPKALEAIGAHRAADYVFERDGVEGVEAQLIIDERTPERSVYYQYVVGLVYLAIGVFVFYRRSSAPRAQHFYILCLASFVLSTFHFTGKLNDFDKAIYWGNVAAGLLAPTIFVHFAASFPEPRRWMRGFWRASALYLPALAIFGLYLALASGTLRVNAVSLVELNWILDRTWLTFLATAYMVGAGIAAIEYRQADEPILRQQLKWLRNGAILGVLPFTLLNVVPYLFGAVPGPYMKLAVFSLILVPLTWAYAVLRYRLMDVDVIFQQGYAYTLATLAVLGVLYGLVLSVGQFDDLSSTAIVILILIATFVFQPIRNWIQEQLDRYYFYKDRYDYRRTLIEFARELGSETDLDKMLESVADRLIHTLSIQHVAFFLANEVEERFELRKTVGRTPPENWQMDLSFLSTKPEKPYIFIERTRNPLDVVSHDWPASVRRTIADLDLTYYLPCSVRGRTIAYLGFSRTNKGDFLTSDDLQLLVTLSGYVGIAVENARLYHSLQSKVEQYERLKDFSENIVESINVGILAADLEDRVESWNTQIEALTGIPREVAVRRSLDELFPPDLVEQFTAARQESGIFHVYKYVLKATDIPAGLRLDKGPANGNGANGAGTNGGGARGRSAERWQDATLNVAIAPLVSKDRVQIGRLIIFDDITDRSELERKLMEADKLSSIGLLAAGVAHEVNTPLAVISTYAQMLARQVSQDDQKSKILDKIASQTFRASEIVNSLLNFSRTSKTEFGDVDLNGIINETIALLEHQLEKNGVAVECALDESLPAIQGNSGKLQQVFLNLFLNARDAMDSGGVLRVRTSASNGSALVDVADNGKGIPADTLGRIYDPFFTTKVANKGTGLGLSVTYGIVREHGGTIEVESLPGAGTCFHLDFPVVRKPVIA